MTSFQHLPVWKMAHALALDVYRITERFPIEERLSFTPHMRWAASTIPASIAQGSRLTNNDVLEQCLTTAERALQELAYYIELSRELGYLVHEHMELLSEEVDTIGRLLRDWRAPAYQRSNDGGSHLR